MKKIAYPYAEVFDPTWSDQEIELADHLSGFSQDLENHVLSALQDRASSKNIVYNIRYHQIIDPKILSKYPNLNIYFDPIWYSSSTLDHFLNHTQHPELTFDKFLCSFNGGPHVSRKLLVAILKRFGWFHPDTCSKNFAYTVDVIDGHINDHVDSRFYRKFFISDDSEEFFQKIFSFGHVRHNHRSNIFNLEDKLTQSFLHVVSETMATSYWPFVTEKFLYSVVTRGLFLAYAQPGWQEHVVKYYGFRKYDRIFDYRFDEIKNPVQRLLELMTMIGKFSILSSDDWRDLYDMEIENIEFNYDHYFSRNYLKHLEKFCEKSYTIKNKGLYYGQTL